MKCEKRRILAYDRYYFDLHIHDSVFDCPLAENDTDMRAFFQPSAYATKLGDMVFQWRDMDTETIAHEVFHVIEEMRLRRCRKFSDHRDAEEFYARRLEKLIKRVRAFAPK